MIKITKFKYLALFLFIMQETIDKSVHDFKRYRSRVFRDNFSLDRLRHDGTRPSKIFSEMIPEYGAMIAYDLPGRVLRKLDWFGKELKSTIPSLMIYDEKTGHMNDMSCFVRKDGFSQNDLTELVLFLSEAVYSALPSLKPFSLHFNSWMINQSSVIATAEVADAYVTNQQNIAKQLANIKKDIKHRMNGQYDALEFKDNPLQHVTAARFTQKHPYKHLSESGLMKRVERDSPLGTAEFDQISVGKFRLDSKGFTFTTLETFDLVKKNQTTYESYRT